MSQPPDAPKTGMQKILDVVEKVGNKVPHPVIIFLVLIGIVVLLSAVLDLAGTAVTSEVIVPREAAAESAGDDASPNDAGHDYDTGTTVHYEVMDEDQYSVEPRTIAVRSLLTVDGIRFIYTSLIPSFM